MLQIISGKFFGDGKVYEQETDAVLYSNYSWIAPIRTTVAELRPVDTYGSKIASYVLRYTNRYEQAPGRDPLILAPSEEAVEQFRLIASFYFQSYFHVDRSYVESLCRTQASHSLDKTVPKVLISKFFDLAKKGTNEEAVGFVSFFEKVLSMQRKQYRLLTSCLAGFLEALEALGKNFDLAYSMMVYMLEALSKCVEQPKPVWEDYDQNLRGRLNDQLASVDPNTVEGVRAILLDNPHLKAKKRFVNFISAHVRDAFFTSEAEGLSLALAKSELGRALANLYDARSKYVHELRQVREQLRLPFVGRDNDVFHWQNEPHLTFAGLARLGRHVLTTFIDRQPAVEHEDYPWRKELPGQTEVALAPECWAAHPAGFQPAQARQRFSGFIQHLVTNFSKAQIRPLDLRPLMEPIEALVTKANPADRRPMLTLYWMFNGMVPEEYRRPGWETFLECWKSELECCSIELLTMFVFCGRLLPWPADECAGTFDQYQSSRHKEMATRLPQLAEIAVIGEIANLFHSDGHVGRFEEWMDRAICDAPGRKVVQEYLCSCRQARQRVEALHILGRPITTKAVDSSNGTNATAFTEEDIRLCAYFKWAAAGRQEDDGVYCWLEAEKELLAGS